MSSVNEASRLDAVVRPTQRRSRLSRQARLLIFGAAGIVVLGLLVSLTMWTGPVPRTIETAYEALSPVCEITDPELTAVSGMAVRAEGTWVANDRGTRLFRLDPACAVAQTQDLGQNLAERGVSVVDTEDLAVGQDGWLWLADIGGNTEPRTSVQLVGWRDSLNPVRIVTLVYPDGPQDAEAFIMGPDGRPIVVTKASGEFRVFTTTDPVVDGVSQTLTLAGTRRLPEVDGDGPGAREVTGASLAPTTTFAVIRTYTRAWEFDVPDGDVVAALIGGEPRAVPLPTAAQGEAIAYTIDGRSLLATGEGSPVNVDAVSITRTLR